MYKFYFKYKDEEWVEKTPTKDFKDDLVGMLYGKNSVEVYYSDVSTTWRVEKVELTLEDIIEAENADTLFEDTD